MKKLTVMQISALAVVSIAAVLLLLGYLGIGPLRFLSGDDDEAPIIVRNGSLDLWAGDDPPHNRHWQWTPKAAAGQSPFVHAPQHPDNGGSMTDLQVFIVGTPTGSGCSDVLTGKEVEVHFSDNFYVTLRRTAQSDNRYRTEVNPSAANGLVQGAGLDRRRLRYTGADGGYITSINVEGQAPCTFANKEALDHACVSRSHNVKDACLEDR